MQLPYKTNKLYRVFKWADTSKDPHGTNPEDIEETTDLNLADIVTSQIGSYNRHTLMIDLDVPAVLIPSSTLGHHHLYIDVPMTWSHYVAILEAMANAGILEFGYVGASKARGFTAVRLPWVRRTTMRKKRLGKVDPYRLNAFVADGKSAL